jgi:two-component system nitrate/nitrite sensor histidine kinase NarX
LQRISENQERSANQDRVVTDRMSGSDRVPGLDILSEIASNLAGDNDLESLLGRFLGTIVKLAGAGAGAVRVVTADGRSMRLVSAINLPQDLLDGERLVDVGCGVCGAAVSDNQVRWANDLKYCAHHSACDFFGGRCKRVVAVPLQCKGRVLGVYNLFLDADRDLPAEVASLLRAIGELLGLALENARLTRENLRVSLMNERQMMANEIHDSLAQTLHYMKLRMPLLHESIRQHDEVHSFKYLTDVNQALGTAYSSLRELLTHFRNRMDPHGLVHALQETVDTFFDKTGVRLEFANRAPELHLPIDQELQVFHIVQEALANVGKHSRAKHARLVLDKQGGRYEITIEDDGEGIGECLNDNVDAARREFDGVHFGINIMRERARHLGGDIQIESLSDRGTRVHLAFPVTDSPRGMRS